MKERLKMTAKQRKEILTQAKLNIKKKDWSYKMAKILLPLIRKEVKNDTENQARSSRAS